MLVYTSEGLSYQIAFEDEVLAHFERHKQLRPIDKEAGGQLFARFEEGRTMVTSATGPRKEDKRTRTSYRPSRALEQVEIFHSFARGLHYVGDWHTHPATSPIPSDTDLKNIAAVARESLHELPGLILVVVGTAAFPPGLRVSMNDGANEIVFNCSSVL